MAALAFSLLVNEANWRMAYARTILVMAGPKCSTFNVSCCGVTTTATGEATGRDKAGKDRLRRERTYFPCRDRREPRVLKQRLPALPFSMIGAIGVEHV